MSVLPQAVQKVIDDFERMPGVGPKSAARMAYHFLRATGGEAKQLSEDLAKMSDSIMNCKSCYNVSDKEECDICSSKIRDISKICVVEEPLDVVAFENSGVYDGFYFVLGGVISPADGIGAEELRFHELVLRVNELVKMSDKRPIEVIVATNPSLEGEATASYINDIMKKQIEEGIVIVTRLAMGLPTGADLEYADRITLRRALQGRTGLTI